MTSTFKYSSDDDTKNGTSGSSLAIKYFAHFDSLYNLFVQDEHINLNAGATNDIILLFESLHSMAHEFKEDSMMYITSYLQFISRVLKLSRAQSHPERFIGLVSTTEPSLVKIKTSSKILEFLHQVLKISPAIAKYLWKYRSNCARYSTGFFYVAYLHDLSKFIKSSMGPSDGNL